MPVYEYDCPTDGQFELVRSIRENTDSAKCPTCRKKCEQVVSRTQPPILKGSGFHANSYPDAHYKGT